MPDDVARAFVQRGFSSGSVARKRRRAWGAWGAVQEGGARGESRLKGAELRSYTERLLWGHGCRLSQNQPKRNQHRKLFQAQVPFLSPRLGYS